MSELARDVGISVPTIKKWISVLEASYQVFLRLRQGIVSHLRNKETGVCVFKERNPADN